MAMLDRMRSGSQNFLIYLAFGILIVVFTFYFGPGTDGCQPSSRRVAATVQGTDIYNTDITVLLNRVASRQQSQVDDAEYIEMQKKSLERLSLLYLLANIATKQGFVVTDDELKSYILNDKKNPEYQIYAEKDGKFDPDMYQRFVQHGLEMSIAEYEAFKRRELLVRKYLSVLEESLAPLPSEVEALVELRYTKVNLEYVEFDPKKLQDALTFSDAEIAAFVGDNEDAIKKYYEANKAEYETPKEVHVRRIMIKKPPQTTATDEEKKAAADRWASVQKRVVEEGEDFATVAKELSEDIVYKDKGGDMGWTKVGDMNQQTAKVIETMKQGEVKVDESSFAWFLLKLEGVKEATRREFDTVKPEIARKLMAEKAGDEQLDKLADEFHAAAKAAPTKSLTDILADLEAKADASPTPEPTPDNPPGDNPPGETPPGEDTPDEDAPGDDTPGDDEPAEDNETESVWAKLRPSETGLFSREPRRSFKFEPDKGIVPTTAPWTELPRIGDNKELAVEAFELTKEAPVGSKVFEANGKKFVVRLTERQDPKPEDKERNASAIEMELVRDLAGSYLGAWQTIIYRPDTDLAEASPLLAQVYKEAVESGDIVIKPGVFGLPATPTSDDADGGTGTEGVGEPGEAPAGEPAGEPAPE